MSVVQLRRVVVLSDLPPSMASMVSSPPGELYRAKVLSNVRLPSDSLAPVAYCPVQDSIICDTLGLYARTAEDLQLLLDVFRLEDDEPVKSMQGLQGCKFGFVKTHVWPKATPALHGIWENAKSALTKVGAEVEEVELPKIFENMGEWHRSVFIGNSPNVTQLTSRTPSGVCCRLRVAPLSSATTSPTRTSLILGFSTTFTTRRRSPAKSSSRLTTRSASCDPLLMRLHHAIQL